MSTPAEDRIWEQARMELAKVLGLPHATLQETQPWSVLIDIASRRHAYMERAQLVLVTLTGHANELQAAAKGVKQIAQDLKYTKLSA